MEKIKYPTFVDLTQFAKEESEPKAFYGLPAKVRYCRICVISNQRPNSAVEYDHKPGTLKATINFDKNGTKQILLKFAKLKILS